jgi:cytochrome c oxidase subunit 6a
MNQPQAFVVAEHPHLDEFVPWEHLRIRRKAFPWGDGQHSLFHTDEANALPDGFAEGHGPSAHHH